MTSQELFEGEPLPHVGADVWRKMFQYAKEYSMLAYPETSAPATRPGDRCVLCQQELTPDAADRLRRMEAYIADRASRKAEEAEASLAAALSSLQSLHVPTPASVEQSLDEYSDMDPRRATRGSDIVDYVGALESRRAILVEGLERGMLSELPELPASVAPVLLEEASSLETEASALERAKNDNDRRMALTQSHNELSARKQLRQALPTILTRRDQLIRWNKLKQCKAATSTQAISRKVTDLRRELVTKRLSDRIRRELEWLGLTHIPLKIHEESSRGESLLHVGIDSNVKVDNSCILSEGEQKTLALGCFLAEVCDLPSKDAIILDDPVSSLDHMRVRRVAKRLVEEAAEGRQVIVFTHNIVFLNEVRNAAAAHQPAVPLATHCVYRSEEHGFGVVAESDEPWLAKKVDDRIRRLRTKQSRLPRDAPMSEGERYRAMIKDFYSDLRETWERVVEECVLYGVIERFCTDVKTQKLKGVVVDGGDYHKVYWAMKCASEWSGHDMASARNISPPDRGTNRQRHT